MDFPRPLQKQYILALYGNYYQATKEVNAKIVKNGSIERLEPICHFESTSLKTQRFLELFHVDERNRG